MKNFFNEVMEEVQLRYGKPITLETKKEREILKEILEESKAGTFGKKAKIKQRRLTKKQEHTTTNLSSDAISFELFNEIYNEESFLLQHSSDAYELVTKGFQKGASYTAPGNPGSAFNEVMSNEGVLILDKKYMSETELALVLFYRTKNTELGKQQKDQIRDGIDIPEEITRYDQDLYITCFLAARSAIKKYNRAKLGRSKIKSTSELKVFGGSVKDLKELSEHIIVADTCYIYDEELNHLVKIPRLKLFHWALSAGGGVNAGDTVVLSVFENGDILYDGWSDKKALTDIQSNGTLVNDFNSYIQLVYHLSDNGYISVYDSLKIVDNIGEYQNQITQIEEQYRNAAIGESRYFLSLDSTRRELLAIWLDMQETFYQRNKTSNHVENSKKADGFEGASNYDYLEYLLTEGVNKGATRSKVINRMAIMERAWLEFKKQEIPLELDTQGIVSISRENAMNLHSECIKALNKYTVPYFGTELGTLLAFLDGVELLHISKVNKPASLTDYDQYLKRNTHLIMGGIDVTPMLIKKSLDISNVSSFVADNIVGIKEQIIYDTQNKYVTGKHIYLMIMCSKGKSKTIGLKTYRSRSGFSGKTGNTTKWSTDVVKKFKQTCEMI